MLLFCFLGVLGTVAGELHISIFGVGLPIPGYMVWCALFYAASGSWLTWRVGRPLVGLNSLRSQREAELRFALIRASQRVETTARFRDEEWERRKLAPALGKVRGVARRIVYANAKLTGSLPDTDGFQLSLRSSSPRPHISAADVHSAD